MKETSSESREEQESRQRESNEQKDRLEYLDAKVQRFMETGLNTFTKEEVRDLESIWDRGVTQTEKLAFWEFYKKSLPVVK